jgi:hypothetical protein
MEEFAEDLPWGALASFDADDGGVISYIDKNLQVRSITVGKSRRWIPCFLVDNVDEATIKYLKQALRLDSPDAQEMRHLKRGDGFFLCTVRNPV